MKRWIVLLIFVSSTLAQNRKISLFINPGCTSGCSADKNLLAYVSAEGSNDTLHHIWDFTHKPSIILALTPPNTTLSIDWPEFLDGAKAGSIKFSTPPISVFSFVLYNLIEFNDVKNEALYDPTKFNETNAIVYYTRDFKWKLDSSKTKNTSDLATIVLEGKHHLGHKLEGVVSITLSAFGTLDHSTIQPHLLHTVNASQIDVVLDKLSTRENSSRIALGLTMASQIYTDPVELDTRKSNDDEHSPGVFTIGEVKMNPGYLTWRSVAYTSPQRQPTALTNVAPAIYPVLYNDSLHHTAISSLFGNKTDELLVKSSIFSFGEAGVDDFYFKSNYLSWTFLGGIGEPVDDSFSLLVKLITIFGIGLPAVLIVIVLSCIVFKRLSRQTHDIVFAES